MSHSRATSNTDQFNLAELQRSIWLVVVDDCTQGLEPECVASVVNLRAVGKCGDDVHLRAEIDVVPGLTLREPGSTSFRHCRSDNS